jgi:hypothetical protein
MPTKLQGLCTPGPKALGFEGAIVCSKGVKAETMPTSFERIDETLERELRFHQ